VPLKPTKLSVVSYQVGFGDCFLLSFKYAKDSRHVLIDFGSTGLPQGIPKSRLTDIANDVKARTNGKLDAIVETHRHRDHISGFATNKKGTASGDIIATLKPDLVVQPWTEDPDAKPDAKQATATMTGKQAFVAALDAMHDVAEATTAEARLLAAGLPRAVADQLAFQGAKNLANASAVTNLMRMGKRHAYVNYESQSGLGTILPGVTVTVLGPPNLVQSKAITKERSTDAAEFWQLQALSGRRYSIARGDPLPRSASVPAGQGPESTRWFRRRAQNIRADGLLELVRILDKQMNNTSVILLFEVGSKAFLFPGDAQLENWQYALAQKQKDKTKSRLSHVVLYKVGHHGSRNATPKSMWAMLTRQSPTATPTRLKTTVSTMAGKFGSLQKKTEVPRQSLVAELKKQSTYFTTQDLHGNTLSHVLEFPL
jgi:hypothetical protein